MKENKVKLDTEICKGNVVEVQTILKESNVFLDDLLLTHSKKGQTSLYVAAENNQSKIVEILLEKGKCNPKILKEILLKVDAIHENTPLHQAVQLKYSYTVQSLLKFFKTNLVGRKGWLRRIFTQCNQNKMSVLEVAYVRKSHQIAKLILEFMDKHLPDIILDQIERIGGTQMILKWTDENNYYDLRHRLFKRIGSREILKCELFNAAAQIKSDGDESNRMGLNFMDLLYMNKNKKALKEILVETNIENKSFMDTLVDARAFIPISWILHRFKSDPKFLRKFLLNIDYSTSVNTDFLYCMLCIEYGPAHEFPGIVEQALFKPFSYERTAMHLAIRKNELNNANSILNYAKKYCDKKKVEDLLLLTDLSNSDVFQCVIDGWNSPDGMEQIRFLVNSLGEYSHLLKKFISATLLPEMDPMTQQITCSKSNLSNGRHILFDKLTLDSQRANVFQIKLLSLFLRHATENGSVFESISSYWNSERLFDDIVFITGGDNQRRKRIIRVEYKLDLDVENTENQNTIDINEWLISSKEFGLLNNFKYYICKRNINEGSKKKLPKLQNFR